MVALRNRSGSLFAQMARARVARRDRALRSAVESLEARALLSTTWQNVQIGGGGFVTGLAASSTGTGIYARTDVGGAYRWDSVSSSWRPITDTLPNDANNNGHPYGIGSIAVDPNNANRVFISSGKYNYSSPSGIYISSDTSVTNPTWTAIDSTVRVIGNGGARQTGERLVVDPNNSNVVYYGTNNVSGYGSGLRKYYYDTSWHTTTLSTPAVGDTDYGITFVVADKNGGTVSDGTRTVSKYLYIGVFSATAGNGGVYGSSDGGATWTKITGVAVDKPYRGEVGTDGTLYVTFDGTFAGNGGVVKLSRGSTTFSSIAPGGNLIYNAIAVDPTVSGTVMVGEYTGSNRIWRSINGGSTWAQMTRTVYTTEPDGTPSVTAKGGFDHIADLMINPANLDEVWAGDFAGVQRTQNIKDDTTASTWYQLQKNMEEVCNLGLKSAPTGSALLSADADVNGFVHNNPDVRPTGNDKFDNPGYISTTGLDFGESTSGGSTVWARVGDIFYYTGTDSDRTGGISIDDGQTWAAFGQLDSKNIANSSTAGWETFDVGPYLAQQKAAGVNTVTFVLRASAWQTNQYFLHFSSKEGTNAPQLLVNGSTTLTTTADAMVYKGAQTTNYGNSTELQAQNYYDQNGYTRWSFVKFDLSSVGGISSAALRLYRLAGTDTYSFRTSIYSTPTTSWIEGNGGTDNNPVGEITWTNMPTDLYAPPSGATGGRVSISASDPAKLVWVAENGYVWYSRNRGVTWARGTLGGANLAVDALSEFTMDKMPLASDRVAADTFYVYSKTGGGTVYRSTDGGATWTSLVSAVGTANSYKLQTLPGVSGRFWYIDQNWNVAAHFKYFNGTSMVNVSGTSSVVDFAFGKAAPGNSNPTVYIRKANGTYWYSTDATAGSTFTWTQASVAAINDQPSVMEGDRQTFGRFYVGTNGRGIYYVDVVSSFTWDGGPGGTGTSWNVAANWNTDTVPPSYSTVTFDGTGLTAGKVITLDANQAINQLVIATTTQFTIGSGTTYSLSLGGIDRQDVSGTESNQTIAAPVVLAANSTFTVNGSGTLISTGGISGAYTLTKQGSAQLDVAANTYTGDTTVLAGTLRATAAGAIQGNLIVGGGASAASFASTGTSDAILNSRSVTVNTNGTVSFGSGSENVSAVIVNGGTFNTNYSYVNGSITMTGGTIGGSGAVYGNHSTITTNASASTANFTTGNSLYGYANSTFNVADGAAPVDLKVTGALASGSASYNMTKSGAGVMSLSASNSQANATFSITNGTLLVNNTSGSGTGKSAVSVSATSANATLGGTGIIGGVSGYTSANVTLTGSASYTAALAPGAINESTGAHTIGTLTVGSAVQNNNVTFNGYSRLSSSISGDSLDQLVVNGNLTIGASSTTLAISASGTQSANSYTLVSWTGTRTGTFAAITGVPAGFQVVYGTSSITLERTEYILDNTSGSGVAITGSWVASTSIPEYYGSNYIHDDNSGKGTKSVQFSPTLSVSGSYEVFIWWTDGTNRASNVPVDVNYSGGSTTLTIDQRTGGGQWVSLGIYSFDAGSAGNVTIRTTGTDGYVIADAIKFVLQ